MRATLLGLAVVLAGAAAAQQAPAPENQQLIARPTYEPDKGPVVAIDEAHKNTHTFGGRRLQRFVRLLSQDGYGVRPLAEAISHSSLKDVDVLVVAKPGGWEGPEASLNDAEVTALVEWVRAGGSLLLILDHSPAPAFAQRVTEALGVEDWHDGFAAVEPAYLILFHRASEETRPELAHTAWDWPTYQGADARLEEHAITRGRSPEEQVSFVLPIVGSAFRLPPDAEPLLTLPQRTVSLQRAWVQQESRWEPVTPDTPRTPVGGWAQGAVMKFGKGRVALFGDIGLFSAEEPVHLATAENRKFVLNVMRWLSGVL